MKILIAGAPKTGNMWLKHILGNLYGLEEVDLSGVPDFRVHLDANYKAFVTHQHFQPKPYILEWGSQVGASFITMARHPGDLFVSLYFYVNQYADQWRESGVLGHTPSHCLIEQPLESKVVLDYLENDFHEECLGKTMAWEDSGVASLVRYEDLKRAPLETLQTLTQKLGPMAREDLAEAIRKSEFRVMRKHAGPGMKAHFRKGKMGGWNCWLNGDHCDIIARVCGEAMGRWDYDFPQKPTRLPIFKKWW